MKKTRMKPAERKATLIAVGLNLAEAGHYSKVTKEKLALESDVAPATVQYHFETMGQFRRALMRAAVEQRREIVVGQGLVMKDPQALKADDALKELAQSAVFS